MLQTVTIDITDVQREWLTRLKAALDKQRLLSLPHAIYMAFRGYSWIEGEPIACKLNGDGILAANRLLEKKKTGKPARRKH